MKSVLGSFEVLDRMRCFLSSDFVCGDQTRKEVGLFSFPRYKLHWRSDDAEVSGQ